MQSVIISFSDILERIRSATSAKNDADIARLLGVPPKKLAVWKLRNTIPYEEVISFCREQGLELEWVLTGERKIQVSDNTQELKIRAGYVEGIREPLVFLEEPEAHIHPQMAEKIITEILRSMTEAQKTDLVRYAEERILLAELLKERSKTHRTKTRR